MSITEPNKSYKVGRILSKYELHDLHDQLPDLWLENESESVSLRDLADRINTAILQQSLENAGMDPIDGEAENAYRVLTADGVSAGARTQQRNQLERAGIDVDALKDDFITHQAVHTYLTQALAVSKENDSNQTETRRRNIQRLRGRMEAIINDTLTTFRNTDRLVLGEFDTTIDIQVYCRTCQTQYKLRDLLDRGGCTCDSE